MVTPRFNFVQLFGIIWIIPLLAVLMIIIVEQPNNNILFLALIAIVSLLISGNFLFKKKWVRYLIAIGLVLFCILIGFILFDSFNSENDRGFIISSCFSLSGLSFNFGVFLLTFNIGTVVEFERKRKEPIDYTKALHHAQLNQHYFLKNTLNLTTPISLMLIAPAFTSLIGLFYAVSRGVFNLNNNEDIFLVFIAFSSLACGIGTFLKFKIIRYITFIVFVLIGIFTLSEIQGSISYKELIIIIGLAIIGITFVSAFLAMLFHPIITYSFKNSVKSIDDYEDILDFE